MGPARIGLTVFGVLLGIVISGALKIGANQIAVNASGKLRGTKYRFVS